MMCFCAAYFAYLITGCYYYYEKFTGDDGAKFGAQPLVEMFWMVFSSLGYVCMLGVSVRITKEVRREPHEDC